MPALALSHGSACSPISSSLPPSMGTRFEAGERIGVNFTPLSLNLFYRLLYHQMNTILNLSILMQSLLILSLAHNFVHDNFSYK